MTGTQGYVAVNPSGTCAARWANDISIVFALVNEGVRKKVSKTSSESDVIIGWLRKIYRRILLFL